MQETIWEKFFASNEMREHLNQKFKRRDTDSLNRKIREKKEKLGYNSREPEHIQICSSDVQGTQQLGFWVEQKKIEQIFS